jgi:hypothetical protein
VWINCRTYNGEKHPVTNAANVLSEAFEKAWGQANIEHKWQVEVKREEREEQVGIAKPFGSSSSSSSWVMNSWGCSNPASYAHAERGTLLALGTLRAVAKKGGVLSHVAANMYSLNVHLLPAARSATERVLNCAGVC